MPTITEYPIRDPESGELIDNQRTLPAELLERLRQQGLSEEEIRSYRCEVHDARDEIGAILTLVMEPTRGTH